MSSETHRTNGQQFAALGHPSSIYSSQQQQQPSSSHYPNFATRQVFDPHRTASSGTQQLASQSQPSAMNQSHLGSSGGDALGILADVALADGWISADFSTTARPNMPQPATGGYGAGPPPVSHSNSGPFVTHWAPSTTGEYRHDAEHTAAAAYPLWTASTSSTTTHHPSYNQLPSIFEAAAGLRSFSMSVPSITPRCVNNNNTETTGNNSDSCTSFTSSSITTATKKKSSYIVEQMEKVDKVEKDSVGRVRDRTNYFASYYTNHQDGGGAVVSPSNDDDYAGDSGRDNVDTNVNGNEKSPGLESKKRESTRDRPGDKYVKMFQEPGQQRYEDAMLEILDGMELPR